MLGGCELGGCDPDGWEPGCWLLGGALFGGCVVSGGFVGSCPVVGGGVVVDWDVLLSDPLQAAIKPSDKIPTTKVKKTDDDLE